MAEEENKESDESKPRVYQHPIVILGAGLGGMTSALDLRRHGRTDFVMIDRIDCFGGTTWFQAANKTTKLQTEKGSYHVDYMDAMEPVDGLLDTWPSRDQLRDMFSRMADKHGM